MVSIDIRDDFDYWRQIQEGCIRLIGFRHDELTSPQLGIGACTIEQTTDDERRIQSTFGQHTCNQAGGRGLAMRTRNRDTTCLLYTSDAADE